MYLLQEGTKVHTGFKPHRASQSWEEKPGPLPGPKTAPHLWWAQPGFQLHWEGQPPLSPQVPGQRA